MWICVKNIVGDISLEWTSTVLNKWGSGVFYIRKTPEVGGSRECVL